MPSIPNGTRLRPNEKMVEATGAAGAGVTATIPAVTGRFHYISRILIQCYCTSARAGGATPTIVTTTNLAAAATLNFDTAQAIGTQIDKELVPMGEAPVKSSAPGTDTTIVCPATTSVIWHVLVFYFEDSI